MQTYWDLSEKERAELDQAGVERFIDAELMSKGVLKVEPLKLEPVPEIEEPKKVTYYQLHETYTALGLLFASAADAETVRAMRPLKPERYSLNGDWKRPANYASAYKDLTVQTVDLIVEADFHRLKADYERRATIEKINEERTDANEEALKAQQECLAGLWEDWAECQRTGREHAKVQRTWEDYCKTAGDPMIAAKFLRRVFTREQIDAACEWLGFSVPETDDAPPVKKATEPEAEVAF